MATRTPKKCTINACSEKVRDVILDYKKDLDILVSLEQAPDGIVLLKFFNPEFKKLKTLDANAYDPFKVENPNIIVLGGATEAQKRLALAQEVVVAKQSAASSTSSSSNASFSINFK